MARQVSFHLKECFNNFHCSTILGSLTLPIWSGLRGFQVQGTFSYKIEKSSVETRTSWSPYQQTEKTFEVVSAPSLEVIK